MQKINIYPIITAIAALLVGLYLGGEHDFFRAKNAKIEKLNTLIEYIDSDYVDDINTDSIVDVTVNKILENLDPHSIYIPKERLQSVTENMQGDFIGIGVSYKTQNDTITVIKTIKNGPSAKAGILPGDRILFANSDTLFGKKYAIDASKKLKGEEHSEVKLSVYRKTESNLLEFNLKRAKIAIESIEASYMLNPNLAYIKINRFAETTYDEFITALKKLKQEGAKSLVLDLRNNPGGFLDMAEKIADEFLENKKLIVFTKDKKGNIKNTYATQKGIFENHNIYVLINENSASASEIIAGALQDNDKGTIIGRRSFGKGLVQREIKLDDGSAVRLTVSRYYTPTGRSIQKDYKKKDLEKTVPYDSIKHTTPKGKIVYGGGGILPDVVIPSSKQTQNETLKYLENHGYFSTFVFNELEKDRQIYSSFKASDFIENFEVTDDITIKFQDFINSNITSSKLSFHAFYDETKCYIKANLADQLFSRNTYFKILNTIDSDINKAIFLEKETAKDTLISSY